jgi:hypothetical protein
MKITLTARQVQRLMPYFDRVRATAVAGSPGMLVAQLRWDDSRGIYTMEPCFIDHAKALPLVEAGRREIPQ